MPRRPRIVVPDTPHHVVLRANNKRRLFSYPSEYQRFLFFLGRARAMTGCAIHAAVLMTNHVHLVVTPLDAATLARFVKAVAQRYAQTRNQRRVGSGRLFEERYFSCPILSERQLAVTIAYVELNPVRAGMVARPADYPWSTYSLHARGESRIPRGIWTPSAWYESLAPNALERARCYREWLEEARRNDPRPEKVFEVEARTAYERWSRERRPNRSSAA